MSVFHMDEGVLDIPAHWSDRTINVLMSSKGDSSDFSLVVSRDDLEGREFRTYLAGQLKALSKQLPSFRLLGDEESTVGGLPALEARMTWSSDRGTMYQHQAYVPYYDKVLIFTATTHLRLAADCDATLAHVLSTAQLRRREE
jgi:hypothetical protein